MSSAKFIIGTLVILFFSSTFSLASDSLQTILTINNIIPTIWSYSPVVCKGDFNGDGYNDIVLQEKDYNNHCGRVRIFLVVLF